MESKPFILPTPRARACPLAIWKAAGSTPVGAYRFLYIRRMIFPLYLHLSLRTVFQVDYSPAAQII